MQCVDIMRMRNVMKYLNYVSAHIDLWYRLGSYNLGKLFFFMIPYIFKNDGVFIPWQKNTVSTSFEIWPEETHKYRMSYG